jgi:3-methyladenine DNA glycosylase AlkD
MYKAGSKMEFEEVMKELKRLGTAQNRKIYKRHGSGDNLFGVSFANLRKMGKKIKSDHDLAKKLWNSKNMDAMTLATMIADTDKMKKADLERWVKDIDYYVLSDEFARSLVVRSPYAEELMEKWINSKKEYVGRTGWTILALKAMDKDFDYTNSYFKDYLKRIKKDSHGSKNRTKQSMNSTLISIGIRNKGLKDVSLKIADEIGKVNVDVGETYCKIPNARQYIEKTWKRKK